jgi:hypothetical protein
VSLHAGGLVEVLGSTNPLNVSNGTISLNNTTLLVSASFTTSNAPASGTTYTLVQTTGGVTPQFASLANNTVVTINGVSFNITYTATTVILTRSASSGGRGKGSP